jgi:hypothetical protein
MASWRACLRSCGGGLAATDQMDTSWSLEVLLVRELALDRATTHHRPQNEQWAKSFLLCNFVRALRAHTRS